MNSSLASLAVHNPVLARFVDLLEAVDGRQPGLLRVITYHRIVEKDEDTSFSPGLTVSLPVFKEHMAYLSRRYRVLHIEEVLEAARAGSGLPARSLLVTFDDAYQDFAELAWPVLRKHDLPATLFVPTAFPGQPRRVFWWDWLSQAFQFTECRDEMETPAGKFSLSNTGLRLNAYKSLRDYVKGLPDAEVGDLVENICSRLDVPPRGPRILNWAALRELAHQGVTLGAHTRTHPLMNRISQEEMRLEISGSIDDLRRETGQSWPIFAYPGGELSEAAVQLVQEAGIELGFTTRRGINDLKSMDPLRINRINIGQKTSLPILRAQLLARSRLLNR